MTGYCRRAGAGLLQLTNLYAALDAPLALFCLGMYWYTERTIGARFPKEAGCKRNEAEPSTPMKTALAGAASRVSWGYLVEWRRIELPTFALRTRRSPS